MYKKISNQKRLSHEVANQIKTLIRNEKLKPGDKLPNEMELTKLFGVSRSTVREAVKSLISQNIIEIIRGRGTFVSQNPGISSDPLGLDFVLDEDLHLSLIEVRLIIEPAVARLAAERGTPLDIERIGRFIHEMEDIVGRHEVGIGTELEFHRSIAEATENPVIMRIIPVIMDAIVKTYSDAPRTSDEHRQALLEHIKIYEGIKERDPEKAFQAMRRHIENSYQRTISKRVKTKQK
ncbi:MAG: FadR family transcriptional regulator [Spirochaetota bacterium]|nr:MAG: FadR family transcriptional regulator [Spirochaetota bacterium]